MWERIIPFEQKKIYPDFIGWFLRYQKIDIESTGVHLCINNFKFDYKHDHVMKCGILDSFLISQPISFKFFQPVDTYHSYIDLLL